MSQCASLLAFLSDGEPHEMTAIHRAIGFCRLNSRVSELRARGHRIVCDKTGGRYVYTLVGEPLEGGSAASLGRGASAESPSSGPEVVPCETPLVGQLTVYDALVAA